MTTSGGARALRSVLAALAATAVLLTVGAPAASAHPLGNFTVNVYSGVLVAPTAVNVLIVVDSAEIPTLETFPDAATGVDEAMADSYRIERCADLAGAAEVRVDGTRAPLAVTSSEVTFPAGEAGLPTTRLTCRLGTSTQLDTVGSALSYQLSRQADRLGWREITAVGDGVTLENSTVASTSPSGVLSAYPADLLSSPLDIQDASMDIRSGSGVVTGSAPEGTPSDPYSRGVDRLTAAYTNLIASHDLTLPFGILAFGLALVLGAMHAFAPGHGKALMAATLVGREGSLRQAVTIGLSVTVTHSVGVLVLGLALTLTSLVTPEKVYPWLGLVSGVLLVGIGLTLLANASRRQPSLDAAAVTTTAGSAHGGHSHSHHQHAHGDSASVPAPHSHGFFTHTHEPKQLGTRSLLAVGFTGGLVPSPSALLVLLGGIALGRAWFGVVLVVAYGLGMAAALVGVGLALVRCRDWLERQSARLTLHGHGTGLRFVTRWLPAATAALVILLGLGVAARAVSAI